MINTTYGGASNHRWQCTWTVDGLTSWRRDLRVGVGDETCHCFVKKKLRFVLLKVGIELEVGLTLQSSLVTELKWVLLGSMELGVAQFIK